MFLNDWLVRLRTILRRGAVDRDLDDEIRFHLEKQAQAYERAGLPRPEAVRRARLDFGTVDQVKEAYRDASGVRALEDLLRDLRLGVRSLRRRPVSALAATFTLAIGIGVNAAVFAVVDWVLLRPLPYPAANELVQVFTAGTAPATAPAPLTYSEFQALSSSSARARGNVSTLGASTALSTTTRILAGRGVDPAHTTVARIAGDLFTTLRIVPAIGRGFTQREMAAGSPVVVVSERLWRSAFSSDPHIDGRLVTIDGELHTVVGVIPRERGYPRHADIWRPLTAGEREDDDRELVTIARLAPDTGVDRASANLAAVLGGASHGTRTAWVEDLHRSQVRDVRATLTAIFVSAALILLMAAANVAGVLSARAVDRVGEMALRGALGASRSRLARQLLTEHILLAGLGGAAGLLLGRGALAVLIAIAPAEVPRLAEIALDWRIVAAGVAVTAVVAVLVGLAPAFETSRFELRSALAAAGAGRSTARFRGRQTLVTIQTAVAVVLTICAVLLGRSLQHLTTVNNGFDADRLLSVDLYLRGTALGDSRVLFQEIVDAAASVPGVRSSAVALRLPTQIAGLRMRVRPDGAAGDIAATVTLRPVTPGYFGTAAIPFVAGRDFTANDRRDSAAVAIVNAAFAREAFGRAEALGTRLSTTLIKRPLSIVGVVADVTPAGERDLPAVYVPVEQVPIGGGFLVVRTEHEPGPVVAVLRDRLRAAAPSLALDRIQILSDSLERGRSVTRFTARLTFAFAMLALMLAATAVYALTSGEVAARWRELAIRLALGATRRQALWTVIRPGAIALTIGLALGAAGALGLGRWIRVLLRGIGPSDPATLLAVPIVLAAVGALAALLAAVRVVREDPAAALHRD